MTPENTSAAAEILAAARGHNDLLDGLPEFCRPQSAVEAHAIQDATIKLLDGKRGAVKVNAFPQGGFIRGVVVTDRIQKSPGTVAMTAGFAGLEPEIAFHFPNGVPAQENPYRRQDVAAMAEAMPVFDIVESRYSDFMERTQFERAADCLSAGWLVTGKGRADWDNIETNAPDLIVKRNGKAIFSGKGRHSLGDPFLPVLHWLNARREEGCAAGTIVTTGSFAGLITAEPGDTLVVEFDGLEPISLSISAEAGT